MKTFRQFLLVLFAAALCFAQSATRIVTIAWTVSTTAGITGYNVYRIVGTPSATSPLPAPLNASPLPATQTQYIDTAAVIGTSYTYALTSVTAACPAVPTATTSACGSSDPIVAPAITIPPKPGAFTSTIVVQVP